MTYARDVMIVSAGYTVSRYCKTLLFWSNCESNALHPALNNALVTIVTFIGTISAYALNVC